MKTIVENDGYKDCIWVGAILKENETLAIKSLAKSWSKDQEILCFPEINIFVSLFVDRVYFSNFKM